MAQNSGIGILIRDKVEAEKLAAVAFGVCGYNKPYQDTVQQLFIQFVEILSHYSEFYCSTCHKTGTTVIVDSSGDDIYLRTNNCVCKNFKRVNEQVHVNVQMSGIPVRYHDARLDRWNNPGRDAREQEMNNRSIHVVRSYGKRIDKMKNKGYGLFLCGPNGVGKTYLACALAVEAVRHSFDVRYYTMSKIVRTVVDGWYDDELKVVVRDIENTPFLVIDDLDKPYTTKTGLEISVLDNLFRERMQNNRPMIVTSNMPLDKLAATHGKSVASMFSEHCVQCVFVGADYREGIAGRMLDDILES